MPPPSEWEQRQLDQQSGAKLDRVATRYESTPAGPQGVIPSAGPDVADTLRQRTSAPLRGKTRLVNAPNGWRTIPAKPQLACDHGLFGDEHLQLDLVEMLQEPTND